MADLAQLGESIKAALGGAATGVTLARGELTLDVAAADILKVMVYLRNGEDFKILVDVCGNDWPQRAKRFDVVYHLLSLTRNARIRVKAQVPAGHKIALRDIAEGEELTAAYGETHHAGRLSCRCGAPRCQGRL